MSTVVKFLLIFSLTLPLAGCAATFIAPAISGAAFLYITWKEGEATKYYHYNTGVVHRAACLALQDLELKVGQDSATQDAGKTRRGFLSRKQPSPSSSKNFQMLAGNSNRFKIKIEHVEKDICRLKVRIDFWGDKPYVEMFYQKVDEYLNTVTFGPDGKAKLNKQGAR